MLSNNAVVLFRLTDPSFQEELEAANTCFNVIKNRCELDDVLFDLSICDDYIVIPRYSALPYFEEMEADIKYLGARPIHSYKFHRWIASFDWYETLKPFTPYTWRGHDALERFVRSGWIDMGGAAVLKGCTNSRKFDWNRSMYADTWSKVNSIYSELRRDGLIGYQDIIIREYIPLKTHAVGLHGMRFTEEYRVFCLGNQIIDSGYYWSTAPDEIVDQKISDSTPQPALDLARKLANLVSAQWQDIEKTPFYVLDIAQKEDGEWILIEMNDGMMSGLSTIDQGRFYNNLREQINELA